MTKVILLLNFKAELRFKINLIKKLYLLLIVAILAGVSSCKKDSDDDLVGDPVTLTANIDQSTTGASKVVAISPRSGYRLVNIFNNQFSVEIDNGQPWALVFLTSGNEQLGYIKLTSTIESLSMYYAPADITSINLGSLSKDGFVFTPDIDPLQTSIPLSGTEQLAVGQSDDWFAASANNLDVDGNGTLDFME